MSHLPEYDIVIIGSGLGGLLCGNILSKSGYKVCILEKHHQIGGNLQTFKRNGCVFDTGLHYLGCLDKGQILHQVYKYIGILDQMGIERMDEDGFDVISIGDREFKFKNGYEGFANGLKEYFPDETEAIDTYINTLKSVWQATNLLNFDGSLTDEMPGIWKFGQNAHDFIDGLTSNPLLKAVLAGNNGLYTGNSKKTPLYLLANINSFFIQSAWRLAHGGSGMANAMRDNIEKMGGKVLTNHTVVSLNADKSSVSAAVLADGSEVTGKWFISNIHSSLTMDLLEPGILRNVYVTRIKELENTISAFTLNLVLKKETVLHSHSNLYYSKDENVWDLNADPDQEWPHGYMLYTTRDGESDYACSMTIITMMRFDEVKQWADSELGKRSDDYQHFKKEKEQALLRLVENKYPNISGCIAHAYASTPLTYRDYTGTINGSIYGIEKDCNNPVHTTVFPYTKIKNLLMTGQNTNIHGTLGVTMGALLTCASIINLEELMTEIKNC
jgi:phytoene dehydrogenase-like protein